MSIEKKIDALWIKHIKKEMKLVAWWLSHCSYQKLFWKANLKYSSNAWKQQRNVNLYLELYEPGYEFICQDPSVLELMEKVLNECRRVISAALQIL